MFPDCSPNVLAVPVKTCRRCGETKTYDQFSPEKANRDGLKPYCKPCVAEKKRLYVARNHEVVLERKRQFRERNRNKIREDQRIYAKNNRQAINKRNRRRYADNVESRLINNRRRARKLLLSDTFTVADWRIALEYFNYACATCGQGLMFLSHQDHWIPLSSPDCPGTVPHNMVPLCSKCNLSKNSKMPIDWLIEHFGPRKGRAILRKIEAFLDSRRPTS